MIEDFTESKIIETCLCWSSEPSFLYILNDDFVYKLLICIRPKVL